MRSWSGGQLQYIRAVPRPRRPWGPVLPWSASTGIFDPFLFGSANGSANQNLAFQRTKKAGASTALLYFSWRSMVTGGNTKPANFDASDPGDTHYRWPRIDAQVKAAVAAGLQPIALVSEPPDWAAAQGVYGRNYQPSPSELKLFATALARRYSGTYQGLPRIRYWSVWNEPNLPFYLEPQIDNGVLASAAWYRSMVNNFAEGVHGVLADNMVIAGNLAPFTSRTGAQDRWGIAPLTFMRALLCLQPVCNEPVHFDIWAHHPYTSGGPNHKATRPNDVSLGDLPKMRKVLVDGIKVGHVLSATEVRFWVTEFSYESNPPDPGGLKPGLGARWTSEALYRMWRAGVTQVTWFLLTDQPYTRSSASPASTCVEARRLSPTSPSGFFWPFASPSWRTRSATRRQAAIGRRRTCGTGSACSCGDVFRRDSASASSSSSGAERPGVLSPRSRRTSTGSSAARSTPYQGVGTRPRARRKDGEPRLLVGASEGQVHQPVRRKLERLASPRTPG